MLIDRYPNFAICYGARDQSFPVRYFFNINDSKQLLAQPPFCNIAPKLGIHSLVTLRQIHSAVGYTLDNKAQLLQPYTAEGDYLITNLKGVGMGIATADCLPVIIIDTQNKVAGIAHASAAASLKSIAHIMLTDMTKHYNTQPSRVKVLFGPSARACCYEVKKDFIVRLAPFDYAHKAIHARNGKLYFDLPFFNQLQLESREISPEAFDLRRNACTICDLSYSSHRREGSASNRQMTIITLL